MPQLERKSFEKIVAQLVGSTRALDEPTADRPAAEGLHVCPICDSMLVYPTSWTEARDGTWAVTRTCPNCEWVGVGAFEDVLVQDFERELDRGDAELEADLVRLVHTNMADEIDRFVRALDANAIQPMDF